jgi:hypothetical protein
MADITTGAQTVSAAGPVAGTLSTAALSEIPTLKLSVSSLSAGATARIAIEDTASTTAFSDAQQAHVWDLEGPITKAEDDESATADMIPSLRIGETNNALRANVLFLTAGASLTLHAFTD